MKTYLILPGCDDTNRGDQALIWETARLARDAGYDGSFIMLADKEKAQQSQAYGIKSMDYILNHPSNHFSSRNNIEYTTLLKIKWAIAAVCDLLYALPLLSPTLRRIFKRFYSAKCQSILEYYENSDISFVKGGGFLHAYGGWSESYKIFFFLYHIYLALSHGHTVYVLPNSFGPFNAPLASFLIRKALKRCKLITSRESISQKALQAIGVESTHMPDLAFYLKKDLHFDAASELAVCNIPVRNSKCVAITVRPYRFHGSKNAQLLYSKYIESMAQFAIWLSDKGYLPVFVEHVSSDLDHENDAIAIAQVEEYIKKSGRDCQYRIYSNKDLNSSQLKCIYAEMYCTVGTRFHSVIFSLAECVPSIAVSYGGNKGDGIMQDLGLNDYTVRITEIGANLLIEKFENLINHYSDYKDNLAMSMVKMEEKRNEAIMQIAKETL